MIHDHRTNLMIFGENVGELVNKRGWIIATRYLEKLMKKKVTIDFAVFSLLMEEI